MLNGGFAKFNSAEIADPAAGPAPDSKLGDVSSLCVFGGMGNVKLGGEPLCVFGGMGNVKRGGEPNTGNCAIVPGLAGAVTDG